jgi:hypothetical protein
VERWDSVFFVSGLFQRKKIGGDREVVCGCVVIGVSYRVEVKSV